MKRIFRHAASLVLSAVSLAVCTCLSAQEIPVEKLVDKQWVVFDISPRKAIVTIDTLPSLSVTNGMAQALLAPGKHRYVVESPFHIDTSDVFELDKDEKLFLKITLEPVYAYLQVTSYLPGAKFFIDGAFAGIQTFKSGKLIAGDHTLVMLYDGLCWYSSSISLKEGENRQLLLSAADFHPRDITVALAELGMSPENLQEKDAVMAPGGAFEEGKWTSLSISSNVKGARVLLNGVEKDTAPCVISPLRAGLKYRVTLIKEGYAEKTEFVTLGNDELNELVVKMKKKK